MNMRVLFASPQAIEEALVILRKGGVIAHATETCYGLACDLKNPEAVKRLFAIKHRPPDQPVSALFASLAEVEKYVQWNNEAEQLARQYLPGPLTLILSMRIDAPRIFVNPDPNNELTNKPIRQAQGRRINDTIGIRVSSHPVAMELAARFGGPLSTTSANIHGEPNPYDTAAIIQQFKDQEAQPDIILDSGTLPFVPPSTVIDVSQPGRQSTKRQGEVRT